MAGTNRRFAALRRVGFLNDPLAHFIAAGAVLFAAYAWLNNDNVQIAVPPVRIGDAK